MGIRISIRISADGAVSVDPLLDILSQGVVEVIHCRINLEVVNDNPAKNGCAKPIVMQEGFKTSVSLPLANQGVVI